jgi:hypothetical protein
MEVKMQLAPEHTQALQQLSQSGTVTFTIPPELLTVLVKVLQTSGTVVLQELITQLKTLNFGPLTPVIISLANSLGASLLALLNNLIPKPGPAPAPTPSGPIVDVGQ